MRQSGGDVRKHHADAAGDDVRHGRRRALVGHMEHVEAGEPRESCARDDRGRTAAGIGVFAGILLHECDQFLDRIGGNFRIDHQHEWQVAGARDRREILDGIVVHGLEQIRIGRMRRVRSHEQRVAIGGRAGNEAGSDRAIGSGLVVDDRGRIQRSAELLGDQARRGVGAAAGSEGQDQGDRAIGVACVLRHGAGQGHRRCAD